MPRQRFRASWRQLDDTSSSRSRTTLALIVTVSVLCTSATAAQPADAGTYVMRNCNVPGQPYAPLGPWTMPDPQGAYQDLTISDNCATGSGVSFILGDSQQLPGGGFRTIGIYEPTGPRSTIKFVKAILHYAARLAGSGQSLSFWTGEYRWGVGAFPGLSNGPPGSENLVGEQLLAPDTTEFRVGVGCGPAPTSAAEPPCTAANRVPLTIRGMEVTLSEDEPPFVLPPSGALVEGGPRSGIETLSISASDPQSGIKQIDVLLGESVVASRDLTSRCPESDFTVCPASVEATLQIDTRAIANGTHRLTVRVRDAAGNVRTVQSTRAVYITNESPTGSLTAKPYTIAVRFTGTARSTTTVPYGHRLTLRGRLSRGSDSVPAGTRVEVLERLGRRGARERSTRSVTTQPDGSFSIGLATSRPSRVVRLAYRPSAGGQTFSRALKLRVMAGSRVRATLRGRVVRFSGRVLSGPIPVGGKRVQMEGRSPGSAWTPFKSLHTDNNGRFSGTYRLRVRRPGVVLKIRAVVPSETGYGYVGSRSRAVSLRVR